VDRVVIAGVGIHPFGRFPVGYRQMGAIAARQALEDAGIELADVDVTLLANVNAEMGKASNTVGLLGRPGVPLIAVENACASSGSALFLGSSLIQSGAASVVLCVGVEKQPKGFIAASGYDAWQLQTGIGLNPIYFALGAQRLLETTEATMEDLADVSVKNHRQARHNPNAMYRQEVTREEVLESRPVCPPLTLLMLCAPNEGAAAAVLMDSERAHRLGVGPPVYVRSVGLASLAADDFFLPNVSFRPDRLTSLTSRAAGLAYEDAGIGPADLDLVECQDTDSASELIAYSELGLCDAGKEAALLRSGDTAAGGRIPVNMSGGLLSKGEPLGASALGQVHELVQQLRGRADSRQVEGAAVGIGHVMGAGGSCAVTVLSR
jgi:acetyl-CoA acetyltransferase